MGLNQQTLINMDIEKVTDLTKNRGEKIMEERERIINNTNNFYGEATGIQIQQGTNNSLQEQTITQEFNYAKVKEVLEQIKKYDSMFDEEYGEKAPELRNMIEEIEVLLQKRENPSKIKMVLTEIKNLSIGIVGSLIASGILATIAPVL